MRIFKFGGASIKDAVGVKNLISVLKYEGIENTLIVVSAMGKMTNAFEAVANAYWNSSDTLEKELTFVRNFHEQLANKLFAEKHPIFYEINKLFGVLSGFMAQNKQRDFNFIYDQIVPVGELLASSIVSAYLNDKAIKNTCLDVRTLIKTDSNYRKASIDWKGTQNNCKQLTTAGKLYITQGFIAADKNNNTTTLGREGSDYTAGILAYCFDAESVTIWKDVDGVLNADPRIFKNTVLLTEISYQEAIEMAFYGASVIHPKTLKPLENKKIPLFVRSFDNLQNRGTRVGKGTEIQPRVPCFIVKNDQILVSISASDFSFMVEENISQIFKLLHDYQLKVTLIQNSAISFSVCLEDNFNHFEVFYKQLKPKFNIKYNSGVSLYTVRHFTEAAMKSIEEKGELLLKQISRETVQMVLINN